MNRYIFVFLIALFVIALVIKWKTQGKPPFVGVALDGYPITESQINRVQEEIQWPPQIIVFYLQWPAPGENFIFPASSLEAIWRKGAIPCLTWEPMYQQEGKERMVSFEQIVKGDYDDYLNFFAQEASKRAFPFIIRFAHEMNLERYHWGTLKEQYGEKSPSLYVQTYQYVVDQFRKGQNNPVLWAFNPNMESVPQASWNQIKSYYPGDSYVDIIGLDGYNWGFTKTQEKDRWDSSWRSFEEMFKEAYRELKNIAPKKPFMIFETASVLEKTESRKKWLEQAIQTCKKWDVEGLVWFHVNKEEDWRLLAEEKPFIEFTLEPPQEWLIELVKKP